MTIAVVILLFGLRVGLWIAPLIVVAAYAAMRGVIAYVPPELHEIVSCTLWLIAGALSCYHKAWVPGFFYTLSGLTYPALLVFGFRLEYMGLSPIIAAVFGLLALAGMGGGVLALALYSSGDRAGYFRWIPHFTLGMAARSLRR